MPLPLFQEKSQHPLAHIKHIIAIAAGKGGVGKSTVTVNLAMALKRLGKKVGIMDTDLYGPSIRKMLPEDQLPLKKDELLYPALSYGMPIMSMAYFRKENEASSVRAPIANNIVSQFIKNVEWGQLDFLLIDFPPGTGDIQLTISQQANLLGAIMVTTPQEVAVLDVRKAIRLFEQVNVPILGIVENMSYYLNPGSDTPMHLFGKGGGKQLAEEFGTHLLGEVPIEPEICTLADQGRTLFNPLQNHSPTVGAFLNVAQQVIVRAENLNQGTGEHLTDFELVWKEVSP